MGFMAICCRDLFQLKNFSKAKLLAGEKGLNREISWPYVRTTESISQWLYGEELIFVIYTDLRTDDDSFLLLIEECIEKKLSGIVVLIDEKDIESIPKNVIDKANEEDFPIIVMPWNIKLIDITQEILFKLEQKQEEKKNAKRFLESIIFSQDHLQEDIHALAEFYNIKLRPFHYVCIFKIKTPSNASYDLEQINKHIIHSLEEAINTENQTLIPMEYANNLMFLIFTNDYSEGEKSVEAVEAVFNLVNSRYAEVENSLSFSRIRELNSDIKISYKEAFKALSMIDIYNRDSKIIKYKELGIIRWLVELSDIKEIQRYCYENLGPILEYDKKHGMDLMGTLKCYFQNNRHLLKTSQELFIHRNTLLYRLSTIKELLKIDLDDAMIDLELFNSILIYEFINLKNKKPL
ncbi:transcriptional regulatory protein [[Clostridium] sordellii]|uniref:PucR C-terminal helix-turn-helix domain protein n=1 Tax=Paraclostridium sordellii TaxID=1505 RepID=A0ABM9RML7_PARSO|nr:PucR family transcriptional regulator [Paeniclostridium sordellii]CEJ73149.1 pucR C-terminal helix-turn-helix domain protein [[Clostridium] sordellii] [Paeniclostridium sordellii]CEN68702.1 transcriptional regulatory protein [[Clostridium] sordellii] [Paeniclostridium sordellii]CEN71969.1 transcriptional regulatory protein [[Clostridium] sordellii] [Paeniclostridium sordellii]CEO22792.1 transcriptional regulatory protein [[Clostridium] sordellii] [Paeniclostridium sordellii]CEP76438.1 trans